MRLLLLSSLVCTFSICAAQTDEIYLSGFTRDSVSFQTLPYVNIQIIAKKVISASDHRGYFSFTCHAGDTLVFTRLGYKPAVFIAFRNEWDLNIILAESARVLQGVTVYDHFTIHGGDQVQNSIREESRSGSSPYKNQTQMPGNERMVQTFGPGITLNGAFSRFSKSEKEKQKLKSIRAESDRTAIYREFIHSMQVRQYLTKLFSLSEDQYLKKLEAFNIQNPDAVYLRSRQEVIDLMVASFASKEN